MRVNLQRKAAVHKYSANVLGRAEEETIVLLHNPPLSVMPALEAGHAVGKMMTDGPMGVLPKTVTYPGFLGGN